MILRDFWSNRYCWKFKINCFYKPLGAKWKYTSPHWGFIEGKLATIRTVWEIQHSLLCMIANTLQKYINTLDEKPKNIEIYFCLQNCPYFRIGSQHLDPVFIDGDAWEFAALKRFSTHFGIGASLAKCTRTLFWLEIRSRDPKKLPTSQFLSQAVLIICHHCHVQQCSPLFITNPDLTAKYSD